MPRIVLAIHFLCFLSMSFAGKCEDFCVGYDDLQGCTELICKQPTKRGAIADSSPVAEQHVFKWPMPHASLLGLYLLAAQKRREKERQAGSDSADGKDSPAAAHEQLMALPDGDEGEKEGQAASGRSSHKDMHYCSVRGETPSHTGVSARSSGSAADSGNGNAVRKEQQPGETWIAPAGYAR